MKILLVDDEQDFVSGLSRLVLTEFEDYEILSANSGEGALTILAQQPVELVITDIQMAGMDGLQLLDAVTKKHPGIKVVILTGFGTIEKAVEAVRRGAFDFLTKPVASEQLYRTITKIADFISLEKENSRLRKLLSDTRKDTMLGESAVMREVRESIEAVAMSDYPVLIFGESGTGKELAARMVHQLSNRKENSYVAVNCPAIPDTLLESELFGHQKGSFTGADRDKEGLFLSADKGTLHLDEIGDISSAMQTKILRFLQEGEVRPVGSNRTLRSDVRIVASTNQPLEQKVESNQFRADLYYRLNVIAIRMPSLRERVEDIALLAAFFLKETCDEMGMASIDFEANVLSYLTTKEWPGNIRELQNYVRRLVVFSDRQDISMNAVQKIESPGGQIASVEPDLGPYKQMKALVADRFSRNYLEQLLKSTGGNVSEAARISGLSRVAIQKLGQRLGVDINRFR